MSTESLIDAHVYICAAFDLHASGGEVEVDFPAYVEGVESSISASDDGGAYVQAWVWVDDTDLTESHHAEAVRQVETLKPEPPKSMQEIRDTLAGFDLQLAHMIDQNEGGEGAAALDAARGSLSAACAHIDDAIEAED